jgi:tRNA(adenine34) deaminase
MAEKNRVSREIDEKYMRMAIAEAERALSKREVPIGAIVVAGDRIIGRGHNLVETLMDATAHAEMQAITAAMSTLGGKYLNDCTLYVTVEPCVMCAGAIVNARLPKLVFGTYEQKSGAILSKFSILSDNGLNHKTEFLGGVLEQDCKKIMQDFFTKLRIGEKYKKNK